MKNATKKFIVVSFFLAVFCLGSLILFAQSSTKPKKPFTCVIQAKNEIILKDKDRNLYEAAKKIDDFYSKLIQAAMPAVVNIVAISKKEYFNDFGFDLDDIFKYFFGFRGNPFKKMIPKRRKAITKALGSGFFISKDGYILTCNHVIENADKIQVTCYNQKKYLAKVIGADKNTDIAVIKITKTITNKPIKNPNFHYLKFADSSTVKVGEACVALGNPLGFGHTATISTVSGTNKAIGNSPFKVEFLQIANALTHGNSGGPIINISGAVIGMASLMMSSPDGGTSYGFIIAANYLVKVANELINKGKVEHGFIGIICQNVTPKLAESLNLSKAGAKTGVIVIKVISENAKKAGLKSGDVIVELNGEKIKNLLHFTNKVYQFKPGEIITLKIWRPKTESILYIKVKLSRQDDIQFTGKDNEYKSDSLGITVNFLTKDKLKQMGFNVNKDAVYISYVNKDVLDLDDEFQIEDKVLLKIDNFEINNIDDFKKAEKYLQKTKNTSHTMLILGKNSKYPAYIGFSILNKSNSNKNKELF